MNLLHLLPVPTIPPPLQIPISVISLLQKNTLKRGTVRGQGLKTGRLASSHEVATPGSWAGASGKRPVMGSQQPGGSHQLTGRWGKQRVSKSAQSICSQVTSAWRGWALCWCLHCLLRKWVSWGKRKKGKPGSSWTWV